MVKPDSRPGYDKKYEEGEGGFKVENMNSYEREKIEKTLGTAEHLVKVIKNYLIMVDYCNEKGIKLQHRKTLETIRQPGELADPMGPFGKLEVEFENGMNDIARDVNGSLHEAELEKRYIK